MLWVFSELPSWILVEGRVDTHSRSLDKDTALRQFEWSLDSMSELNLADVWPGDVDSHDFPRYTETIEVPTRPQWCAPPYRPWVAILGGKLQLQG